ncbi:hypothetical protein BKA69DRAFT_1163098 [Paraphysoderma sedebokerense]|nr:hypothetical protein BKA69DRAFT_1163098 [Paraphysoderma sedebokerense]
MKEYIWKFLQDVPELDVAILSSEEFAALEKPKASPKNQKTRKSTERKGEGISSVGRANSVADDNEYKSSKSVKLKNSTAAELNVKYGEKLRVIARPDVRRLLVLGRDMAISTQLYEVCEAICGFRAKGITQADLAKKLGIDPRSIFHFIKLLCQKNLIVKLPVVTKGAYTHLCLSTRFAHLNPAYVSSVASKDHGSNISKGLEELCTSQNDVIYRASDPDDDEDDNVKFPSLHTDIVKQKITELLDHALNKVMVCEDVLIALAIGVKKSQRKYFNRTLASMVKDGYIERINVPKERGFDRCIRLLRSYQASIQSSSSFAPFAETSMDATTADGNNEAEKNAEHTSAESFVGEGGILTDLPLEMQIYRLVTAKGAEGATASELRQSLHNLHHRPFNKFMSRLLKTKKTPANAVTITRVAEFVGRERRYRYYSEEGYEHLEKREDGNDLEVLNQVNNDLLSKSARERSKQIDGETTFHVPIGDESIALANEAAPTDDVVSNCIKGRKRVPPSSNSEVTSKRARVSSVSFSGNRPDNVLELPITKRHAQSILEFFQKFIPQSAAQSRSNRSTRQNHVLSQLIEVRDRFQADKYHTFNDIDNEIRQVWQSDGAAGNQSTKILAKDIEQSWQALMSNLHIWLRSEEASQSIAGSALVQLPWNADLNPVPVESSPSSPISKVDTVTVNDRLTITSLRRRKILLQIVEEHKVIEVNHVFSRIFQKKFEAEAPQENKYEIDKKTILRACKNLAADGLLSIHIVKVPLLNGGFTTKTVLLHPSLKATDPEVKEYICDMHDKSLYGGGQRLGKVPEENIEVQRLKDMNLPISSLQSNVENEESINRDTNSWRIIAQDYGWIDAKMLRAKLLHQFIYSCLGRVSEPMVSLTSHDPEIMAYFQTTMLFREMTVQLYLNLVGHTTVSESLTKYLSQDPDLTIKLTDLPPNIRSILLESSRRQGRFRRYIAVLINILVALDVLRPVTRVVDPVTHRYVEHVEVNAKDEVAEMDSLRPGYQVRRITQLMDYSLPRGQRTAIKSCSLDTMADVTMFWTELEFQSQRVVAEQAALQTDENGDPDEAADEEMEEDDEEKRELKVKGKQKKKLGSTNHDPLKTITHFRTWRSSYVYTARHRFILDSYVDRKQGETPFDDDSKCNDIARRLGLRVHRVKAYFKRFETDFERKKEAKEKKKAQKEKEKLQSESLTFDGKETTNSGTLQSSHVRSRLHIFADKPFEKQNRYQAAMSRLASSSRHSTAKLKAATPKKRSRSQASNNQGPADEAHGSRKKQKSHRTRQQKNDRIFAHGTSTEGENVPIFESEDRVKKELEKTRRIRLQWKEEEDELILYSYVILRHRSRLHNTRLSWVPVVELFPLRKPSQNLKESTETFRRRFNTLVKNPFIAARLNELSLLWDQLFDEKVHSGILSRDEDDESFHLKDRCQMLKEALNSTETARIVEKTFELPQTVDLLHKTFKVEEGIVSRVMESAKTSFTLSMQLENLITAKSKLTLLYENALCTETGKDCVLDFSVDNSESSNIIGTLRALLKMILLTPDASYDATHAFSLLTLYPAPLLSEAVEIEKSMGSINKVRSAADRKIPGRGFHLSEKFLQLITGLFPERMVPEAVTYFNDILRYRNRPLVLHELINGGSMACLLDLVASKKVILDPILPHLTILQQNIVPKHARKDTTHEASVKITVGDLTPPASTPLSEDVTPIATDDSARPPFDVMVQSLSLTVDTIQQYQTCYQRIKEAVDSGVNIFELKAHMISHYHDIKDAELLDMLKNMMTSFVPSKHPLVYKVGFENVKYISFEYIEFWTVNATKGETRPVVNADSGDNFEISNPAKYTPARLWYDIDGNKSTTVLRTCMTSVLSHIVTKPGIYESALYHRFSTVMSPCELREVLDELVSRNAAKRKCIIVSTTIDLFGPVSTVEECGEFCTGVTDILPPSDSNCNRVDENTIHPNKVSCYFACSGYYLKTNQAS